MVVRAPCGRDHSYVWRPLDRKCHHQPFEWIDLSLNGLEEKKLLFPKEGNTAVVHETILAAFPTLGEGYKILCVGEGWSRQLLLIPMLPNGSSISYLQSVLGQAKGYLWPLQRDIVTEIHWGGIASPDKVCQQSSPTGIGLKVRGELPYKSDGDARHPYLVVHNADCSFT